VCTILQKIKGQPGSFVSVQVQKAHDWARCQQLRNAALAHQLPPTALPLHPLPSRAAGGAGVAVEVARGVSSDLHDRKQDDYQGPVNIQLVGTLLPVNVPLVTRYRSINNWYLVTIARIALSRNMARIALSLVLPCDDGSCCLVGMCGVAALAMPSYALLSSFVAISAFGQQQFMRT